MGAYELALSYALQREQFGRPIAGFQLMQELLVQMLGNVTASLGMAVRNAQLLDAGRGSDAHSALAKEFCASRMRETVAWARQLVGGNGVILGNGVGALLRRRRGAVLVRGHPRDEHVDRRQGGHRPQRVRALTVRTGYLAAVPPPTGRRR